MNILKYSHGSGGVLSNELGINQGHTLSGGGGGGGSGIGKFLEPPA